ncbi:hypothetical protein [Gynuella sp.]|uniref:hypothetical protein n=1 Tax=Gynuella sp. TaxID=2969146 RepID=UPI003D129E1E
MNLEIGVTYYRLTFADAKMTMPGLEPVVYVGKNLFDEPTSEEVYYFQNTVSVVRFGILGGNEDVYVEAFKKDDLGSSVTTLEQAITIMQEANERYIREGKPKLKKANGKWKTIHTS